MKIILKHDSGLIKVVKKGFSWTSFFFGLFVPLLRGDLKWGIIIFVLQLLAGAFTFGLGVFVVSFIFACFYNKIYIKGLLEKGYKPSEEFKELVASYVNP